MDISSAAKGKVQEKEVYLVKAEDPDDPESPFEESFESMHEVRRHVLSCLDEGSTPNEIEIEKVVVRVVSRSNVEIMTVLSSKD